MSTDLLSSLNPPQREAVTHGDGAMLVLAGAGSGKTRVITHRIAHLVRERGVPVGQILAITFTNKAAGEMRERILELVGPEARGLWASTFHSACARILRIEHAAAGYERSFTIYDDGDQQRLMRAVIAEEGLDQKRTTPRAVLGVISSAKNELKGPSEVEDDANGDYGVEVVSRLYKRYQDRLIANQAMDFDDLLMVTVQLLRRDSVVRERWQRRFRHVLVDEYQDTNHAQYWLVRILAEPERNVMVVGDDDQGIYSWRGADIRNILEFKADYPDAVTIPLEQNYRSSATILAAANAVVERNRGRHPKVLWTDKESGEDVTIASSADEYEEARMVVREVGRAIAEGRPLDEIAVFYRTHAQSRVIEDQLVRSGINYQVLGGPRFYERAEVQDLMAYLRVVANPADREAFTRAAGSPKRGLGPAALARVAQAAEGRAVPMDSIAREADLVQGLNASQRDALATLGALFDRLRAMDATGSPPARVMETAIEESGIREALLADGPAESGIGRLDNLQELVGVAVEYAARAEEPTLGGFLEEVALVSAVDEADEDGGRVTLMTVHNAKGLEYDVVIVTGLEEGLFPHMRSIDDPDGLEEERRLCYVALTRARERLILSHADARTLRGNRMYSIPSRFIDEIPADATGRPEPVVLDSPFGDSESFAVPNFDVGDAVVHESFGEGVITGLQQRGRLIQVRFDDKERLLMADMAPMRRLG
ncbi:MAG: UvrD-helicase domain-containing protein [Actinobacteria bacterium]|nr:UvrD-helicase domain-containing protein [Actinomycetota bacterium]